MGQQILSTVALIILSVLCLAISIRAFYVYFQTRSNALLIVGLSMSTIAIGTFCGVAQDLLPANLPLNLDAVWYVGTISGLFFLGLSSIATSNQQLQRIKSWQVIMTALFVVVLLLVPIMPQFSNPILPAILNSCSILLSVLIFVRYAGLYVSKETRFSILMSLAFLFLAVGFGIAMPQLFQPSLSYLEGVGALIRILGYSSLLGAFTLE